VYVINQACLKAARVVLKVLWKEYADAGLTLQEFWDAMRFEIDGAAGSLQLTGIQKRVLETEFFAPPEQKITRPSSSATPAPVPPKTIDTIAAQINRLRNECHLTAEELAEEVELDSRTVQRHLAGETTPYARHLRIYERVFSKILNRQVVISKMP
jgi:hypothetical protein